MEAKQISMNLCPLLKTLSGKIPPLSYTGYFYSIYIYLFVCLFMAALGLHCCARSFSSCSEQGLLFVEMHRLLIAVASLVRSMGSQYAGFSSCSMRAQWLWRTGPAAPRHVGSSWTRAQTHVSCIGRWILNHCATSEDP